MKRNTQKRGGKLKQAWNGKLLYISFCTLSISNKLATEVTSSSSFHFCCLCIEVQNLTCQLYIHYICILLLFYSSLESFLQMFGFCMRVFWLCDTFTTIYSYIIIIWLINNLFFAVCNFVVHERCLKTVVSPCSSIAANLIKVGQYFIFLMNFFFFCS